MANLLRALCLLPLLFSFAQPSFLFPDPLGGESGESNDNNNNNEENDRLYETDYRGEWELVVENSGVSGMHLVLFPNNKAIMFDASELGPSKLRLPRGNCRKIPPAKGKPGGTDCWAHSLEFDIETSEIRPLKVETDPWCSAGGLDAEGKLVNSGGWFLGGKVMRYLEPCDDCDWREYPTALSGGRWYATQVILADGEFVVIGGRKMFSYEFVPREGQSNRGNFYLPLLDETTDISENNLYPFVHLSTDGNLFVFANSRSILLNPIRNKVIREFPVLGGGSRNYPASGMSALLPIKLEGENPEVIPAEVIVCGGNTPEAFRSADKEGKMLPALEDCGRIMITERDAEWKIEQMPSPRVMGDMLILPTGDLLLLNGAKKGTAGWKFGDDPNLVPVIYKPQRPINKRFKELAASTIPRMYHSSSAVLPDGRILVAGSNTNNRYTFEGVKFPTELRVEKFSPPYLDPSLAEHKPEINEVSSENKITYGQRFLIQFNLGEFKLEQPDIEVTMYRPPFTTHGYSMDQRLLRLAIIDLTQILPGIFNIVALAPPSGEIAPPGYYLVFVVHQGVPSRAMWLQIK
ncbi:hypothetical protein L1049_000885 [Liquidambar formosana]|uniref:Uncharacterized protein n=1 Tax=Liquidambar formosana TaxID=63359 RepID=A0AAP0R808_LIQFO